MQSFQNQNSTTAKIKNQEVPESKIKSFENQNSGTMKIKNQEAAESKIKNFENQKSRTVKIENQEVRKSKSNNTNIDKTDFSKNENSETDYSEIDLSETKSDMPVYSNQIISTLSIPATVPDAIEEMELYRNIVRDHISYECFQDARYHRTEEVDELIELIVEVMLMPDDSTIRIAGVEKPVAVVKNKFMKLNQMHIEYVLTCLNANTSKVGNIKSYLLTVLYNATLTIKNYYASEVNHDLYRGG